MLDFPLFAPLSRILLTSRCCVLVLLSRTGETKDTHRSLQQAENLLLPRFSIVNQVGSLLARSTNCGE